jgi:hypothetical protein
MNKYDEIRSKHQKMFDDFPIMFAYTDEQFDEGMKKLGLDPTETNKVVSLGIGSFIRKDDIEAYNEMWNAIRNEHNKYINNDKTGEGYIKDMFISELNNHEYCYTGELEETLDALGLNYDQILENPALEHGLKLATEEILQNSKEEDYEYE